MLCFCTCRCLTSLHFILFIKCIIYRLCDKEMDTKLCRICGKLSENYVHIFKTEGLKNKIETCLPIIVSPHCLLPDTICSECLENVDNFYSFIKNCLQNIIVLEAQYDIMESCLKTKRKHEKGCLTELSCIRKDKNIQTDEDYTDFLLQKENINLIQNAADINQLEVAKLNTALCNIETILNGKDPDTLVPFNILNTKPEQNCSFTLVNYGTESADESDNEVIDKNVGEVIIMPRNKQRSHAKNKTFFTKNRNLDYSIPKKYFDDAENDLISEIAQRKDLKRKNDEILPHRTKICKIDTSNKRKSRQPKKVEYSNNRMINNSPDLTFNGLEKMYEEMERNNVALTKNENKLHECTDEHNIKKTQQEERDVNNSLLPQLCLLCDMQFNGHIALATHIYEMHGIDMAQVLSSEPVMEKRKKLPNLVKITDLKIKNEVQDGTKEQSFEEPPTLQPTFVCSFCPAVLGNRTDQFFHVKVKHPEYAAFMCGLCMQIANSYTNLTTHLETCKQQHTINSKYICKICFYNDNNSKSIENHIAVHYFVLDFCKKQAKVFDPSDYIDINPDADGLNKSLTCTECNQGGFKTFRDFSTHRRSQHQIFHCDLCNKFYGRNSHLWKHVNRLHKGHPSITCQLCSKTSASKYHLAQHFNKIHSAKLFKHKQGEASCENAENFMTQKFQGFDFQSVRQSFLRQELLNQEQKSATLSDEGNSEGEESDLHSTAKLERSKYNCVQEVNMDNECSDVEMYGNDQEEYETRESKHNLHMPNSETKTNTLVSPPKEIDASSNLYTNIITNYTPPQNEGEYKCPKCFKGFHKKTLLKKHKKNCRPRLQKDLLTRCKTCSRIFKDRQSLTKHLINYHSEYECEICKQKVQSKCEIVSHIRFSHPNCHLVCNCGNILRSMSDLLEHKRDHRNSFVCQFCADMLPTKIKLKMHILSLHRKILSLSCGICLKLFETQHILRDHVRLVHKDDLSPLTSCTVCGKNYGSKWKTYDHLNKSHGRIFKACKNCLDVFDTETDLQLHFDSAHINTIQNKSNTTVQSSQNVSNSLGTASNTNINKRDGFESDDCDGDDYKNFSSDFSNDAEGERQMSEEEESVSQTKLKDFTDVVGQENKISLLEKRLLGNRKSVECETSIISSNLSQEMQLSKQKMNTSNLADIQKKTNQDKKLEESSRDKVSKQTDATCGNNCNKKDSDIEMEASLSQKSQQNSSKRTVYVNSNDPSLCEICFKTWPAKKHLWQHYIRCHKVVAATVCGICLKANNNYKTLQIHLQENHPNLLHGQGFGSNFICKICGRYHNARSKLKLHMAIHDNFDWSILEHISLSKGKGTSENQEDENLQEKSNEITNNGYIENCSKIQHDPMLYGDAQSYIDNVKFKSDNIINYESLIEQVECSSDSDSDGEEFSKNSKYLENHTTVNSSSAEESDDDSIVTASEENSEESQMYQNVLKEEYEEDHKFDMTEHIKSAMQDPKDGNLALDQNEISVKEEFSHSDSEDSFDSNQNVSDTDAEMMDDCVNIKTSSDDESSQNSHISQLSDGCLTGDFDNVPKHIETVNQNKKINYENDNANIFVRKSDELDSAIRSISCEQISDVHQPIEVDICEIQPQSLNQYEIQSAVDSILFQINGDYVVLARGDYFTPGI